MNKRSFYFIAVCLIGALSFISCDEDEPKNVENVATYKTDASFTNEKFNISVGDLNKAKWISAYSCEHTCHIIDGSMTREYSYSYSHSVSTGIARINDNKYRVVLTDEGEIGVLDENKTSYVEFIFENDTPVSVTYEIHYKTLDEVQTNTLNLYR